MCVVLIKESKRKELEVDSNREGANSFYRQCASVASEGRCG